MKIIIFAGGYGTRMWPVSRKSNPKQFSKIVRGKSFFERTVERFKLGFKTTDLFVSTEEKYLHFVRSQAPEIPKENLIIEPERKDLLGSVGLVTAILEKRFPGQVMFFSWSDHFVAKERKFIKAVKAAGEFTLKTGKPASVNEKPTFASVHNGWLQVGKKIGVQNGFNLFEIERHVEKPNEETAIKYLKSNDYLIHTGYGAWRSDLMMGYFKQYRPKEYEGLVKIANSLGTPAEDKVIRAEYSKFEKISVEYALFEKLPKDLRVTISINSGWEDAGTWQLFYDAMIEKGESDVIEGPILTQFIDSKKNLILGTSRKKIISVIGLKNIAVIDTKDALLVCDLDETQKVKELYKKLETDHEEYTK